MNNKLSPEEKTYYSRQIRLSQFGEDAQLRLKSSSALLVGLGGLGSPLALYLAGAGVGRIGICEFDQIEISNLHRQVLYGARSAGKNKIDVGIERLRDLNPHIQFDRHSSLDATNARQIIQQYDVVADGADNFQTRYLVNDACVFKKKPLVSSSVLGFEGQLSVFNFENGPCYRCLYPQPPPPEMSPSCNEAGVLGVLPGVMGLLQATEVIKILARLGDVSSGRLLNYEALSMNFLSYEFHRDPQCPLCGENPTIHRLKAEEAACSTVTEITCQELFENQSHFLIIDVRDASERLESSIEGSLHIPLQEILSGSAKVPMEKPIVLQCAAGQRSRQAAQYLTKQGMQNIFNLTGGIAAWNSFLSRR